MDNLFLVLFGVSHPGINFKNLKKWKAKDLGKFLGRQYAGEHLINGEVPVSAQVLKESIKSGDWMENWVNQKQPDFDWKKFNKDHVEQNKIWKQKLQEFMKGDFGFRLRPALRRSLVVFRGVRQGDDYQAG